jgi:hypothetical protein
MRRSSDDAHGNEWLSRISFVNVQSIKSPSPLCVITGTAFNGRNSLEGHGFEVLFL